MKTNEPQTQPPADPMAVRRQARGRQEPLAQQFPGGIPPAVHLEVLDVYRTAVKSALDRLGIGYDDRHKFSSLLHLLVLETQAARLALSRLRDCTVCCVRGDDDTIELSLTAGDISGDLEAMGADVPRLEIPLDLLAIAGGDPSEFVNRNEDCPCGNDDDPPRTPRKVPDPSR